jgi:amino acid permease
MTARGLRTIGWILALVGLAAVIVGIVYLTVPAKSLPSFLGHIAGSTAHHRKRGLAGVGVGILLWIGAAIAFWRARRA